MPADVFLSPVWIRGEDAPIPDTSDFKPDAFDFTIDPKAGGMAPADAFDFTSEGSAAYSSGHTGTVQALMCDGSVRLAGYANPSSFQIISAGKDGGDTEPELTTEPTAPEPYMRLTHDNAIIANYSTSGDAGDGGIIIDYTDVVPTDQYRPTESFFDL